jgi:hypothetical protein
MHEKVQPSQRKSHIADNKRCSLAPVRYHGPHHSSLHAAVLLATKGISNSFCGSSYRENLRHRVRKLSSSGCDGSSRGIVCRPHSKLVTCGESERVGPGVPLLRRLCRGLSLIGILAGIGGLARIGSRARVGSRARIRGRGRIRSRARTGLRTGVITSAWLVWITAGSRRRVAHPFMLPRFPGLDHHAAG